MDKELFKKLLGEVADYKDLETVTPYMTKARLAELDLDEDEDEDEEEIVFDERVLHRPVQVTKLKCANEICADCGVLCEGGRRVENKMYSIHQPNKRHWRKKCLSCGTFEGPDGKYGNNGYEANQKWNDYMKTQKFLDRRKKDK